MRFSRQIKREGKARTHFSYFHALRSGHFFALKALMKDSSVQEQPKKWTGDLISLNWQEMKQEKDFS
jgi:hypothetical protein